MIVFIEWANNFFSTFFYLELWLAVQFIYFFLFSSLGNQHQQNHYVVPNSPGGRNSFHHHHGQNHHNQYHHNHHHYNMSKTNHSKLKKTREIRYVPKSISRDFNFISRKCDSTNDDNFCHGKILEYSRNLYYDNGQL